MGKAYINVHVESVDDIISFYTVKDYECINNDFKNYLDDQLDYVPFDKPILIEISGCKITSEDQEKIKKSIKKYFNAKEKKLENELNNINKEMLYFMISPILIYIVLYILQKISFIKSANELAIIFLILIIIECVNLYMVDRKQLKRDKLMATQMFNANIKFIED